MIRMYSALAVVVLLTLATTARGENISSTVAGGVWSSSSTWSGGVVPGPDDDVTLLGPVTVGVDRECRSLTVDASGSLGSSSPSSRTLSVSETVANSGLVTDAPGFHLTVAFGGDFSSDGSWVNWETVLLGADDRHFVSTGTFESHLIGDAAATGDLVVDAPFSILGNIEIDAAEIILAADSPLTLLGGHLDSDVLAGGNEIRQESFSWLRGGRIDAAVLVGDFAAASQVSFSGGVTIQDGLRNPPWVGSSWVSIEGDLINNGEVRNDTYGLSLSLAGDLVCNGVFTNSHIEMHDASPYALSVGESGVLATSVSLPEFESEALHVLTDVVVTEGLSVGLGSMTLSPGVTVRLDGGGIGGGSLDGQGNTVVGEGSGGAIGFTTIDAVRLEGLIRLAGECTFTGGLETTGELTNQGWLVTDATVKGTFQNRGLIADFGANTLTLHVENDLINLGAIQNSRVEVDGSVDQRIEIGAGIDSPEFVLDSELTAATFQWFRDGAPIPGETAASMTLTTVGDSDLGMYHCEGDGAVSSRIITIAAGVVAVGPDVGVASLIHSVSPEPISRSASVRFVQERVGPVSLRVFDVAGRLNEVLVDRVLPVGIHRVSWRPDRITPGVYFLRLDAGAQTESRKVTIVD